MRQHRREKKRRRPPNKHYWGAGRHRRWFDRWANYACIAQRARGMVVISIHEKRGAARDKAARLSAEIGSVTFAAVALLGDMSKRYRPGDILDPGDIAWEMASERCSECCHPYAYGGPPRSLEHRCVLIRGNPPCDTVMAHRFRRERAHG